jgi:RNA-directed DNA polymerase
VGGYAIEAGIFSEPLSSWKHSGRSEARLTTYIVGWRGYFGFCEPPEVLIGLVRWVRLRLRCALWRQWKTPRRRRAALLQLGVRPRLASNTAGSGRGPWYLARSKALSVGASNAYFRSLGLPSLFENY